MLICQLRKKKKALFFNPTGTLMKHILFQCFLACKILQLEKEQNHFNSVKLSYNAYILL